MPVAQHLLAAGEPGDPAVLHAFFDAAGERAYAASAWAESAEYSEAAMRAAEQLEESTAAAKVTMSLRASRARLQCGEPQAARRNADAAIAALGASPSPESSAVAWIERLRADLFEPNPEVPIDTAPLESLVVALDPASPGIAARAYSTLAPAYWGTRRVEDARDGVLPRHRARQRLRRARGLRGSMGPARDDAVDATRARRRGHELVGRNPRSRRVG